METFKWVRDKELEVLSKEEQKKIAKKNEQHERSSLYKANLNELSKTYHESTFENLEKREKYTAKSDKKMFKSLVVFEKQSSTVQELMIKKVHSEVIGTSYSIENNLNFFTSLPNVDFADYMNDINLLCTVDLSNSENKKKDFEAAAEFIFNVGFSAKKHLSAAKTTFDYLKIINRVRRIKSIYLNKFNELDVKLANSFYDKQEELGFKPSFDELEFSFKKLKELDSKEKLIHMRDVFNKKVDQKREIQETLDRFKASELLVNAKKQKLDLISSYEGYGGAQLKRPYEYNDQNCVEEPEFTENYRDSRKSR